MPGHVSTAGERARPCGPMNVGSHAAPRRSSHRESGVCFEALALDLLQANCPGTVRVQVFAGGGQCRGGWQRAFVNGESGFLPSSQRPLVSKSPLTFSSSLDPKVIGRGLGDSHLYAAWVESLIFVLVNCGLPSAVMCQYFYFTLHFQTFNRKHHPGKFGPVLPNLTSALFYLGYSILETRRSSSCPETDRLRGLLLLNCLSQYATFPTTGPPEDWASSAEAPPEDLVTAGNS